MAWAEVDIGVIPLATKVESQSGVLLVSSGFRIVVPPGDAAALADARWLSETAARVSGPKLSVGGVGPPIIRLVRLRGENDLGPEGYRLDIAASGVRIGAATDAGLFYGAASLLQLLTPENGVAGGVTLKAVHIEDRPRFPWRGLMLDSARHYQSVAFIEALLDQMARYKLNIFHWHLTDDQAWRLEIKRYPRLTGIGAFRVEAGEAHQRDIDPKTGKPRLYGGYYTQSQVREVVAYAKARSITIVPEIEMPGHASAAILAYPELGLQPVDPKSLADWGVFPNLYKPSDRTFGFLQNVLTEVMDLFPGPYIHVGGDEAIKDYWKTSPRGSSADQGAGLERRGRPPELVHTTHRAVHRRPRPPHGGLGRNPRRRRPARGDGDVLARRLRCSGGGQGRSRRHPVPRAALLFRQPPVRQRQ